MGRGHTYHILGETAPDVNGTTRLYTCMNKREMAQQAYTASKENRPIISWTAQTKTGARWIKTPGPWIPTSTAKIKLPKLVDCPACGGLKPKNKDGIKRHCPVCNSSGKTTKGYEKNWQDSQLKYMQKEAGLI